MSERKYFPENHEKLGTGISAFSVGDQIGFSQYFSETSITVCLSFSDSLKLAEHIQNEVAKNTTVVFTEEKLLFSSQLSIHKTKPAVKIDFEQIVEIFHNVCTELPKVRIISTERKRMIGAIAKEYGLESIGEVFTNVSESDFMKGDNSTGWTATFDWIFNKKNFIKILEGNYKNKIPATSQNVIGRQTKETFISNASNWEIK